MLPEAVSDLCFRFGMDPGYQVGEVGVDLKVDRLFGFDRKIW